MALHNIIVRKLDVTSYGKNYFPYGQRKSIFYRKDFAAGFGLGEYAPLAGVHGHDADFALKEIRQGRGVFEFIASMARYHHQLKQMDTAKLCGKNILLSALVSKSDAKGAIDCARDYLSRGYRCLKIKVGKLGFVQEIEKLKAISDMAGPNVALRLDANRRLGFRDAVQLLDGLKNLNIEYVEEPLKNFAQLNKLHDETGMAIAADESFTPDMSLDDLAQEKISVLVIKASRFGNIFWVMEMINKARSMGIKPVLSTCFESDFSGAIFAMMAHELSLLDYAHGIYAADFFATNIFGSKISVVNGALPLDKIFAKLVGISVSADADASTNASDE